MWAVLFIWLGVAAGYLMGRLHARGSVLPFVVCFLPRRELLELQRITHAGSTKVVVSQALATYEHLTNLEREGWSLEVKRGNDNLEVDLGCKKGGNVIPITTARPKVESTADE